MKFISWNIDSLNAALTSDSNRAVLTRKVIDTIIEQDADVIALQETKLPAKGPTKKHMDHLADYFKGYSYVWRSFEEPARKSYSGTKVKSVPGTNLTYKQKEYHIKRIQEN